MDRIGLVRNNDTGGTGKLNKTNRTKNFRMIQAVYVQNSRIICYAFFYWISFICSDHKGAQQLCDCPFIGSKSSVGV